MRQIIVTQKQLTDAMGHWEREHIREHGPLDGVSLPKNVATLADLLGVMWFAKQNEAIILDDSKIAKLLQIPSLAGQLPTVNEIA